MKINQQSVVLDLASGSGDLANLVKKNQIVIALFLMQTNKCLKGPKKKLRTALLF